VWLCEEPMGLFQAFREAIFPALWTPEGDRESETVPEQGGTLVSSLDSKRVRLIFTGYDISPRFPQ